MDNQFFKIKSRITNHMKKVHRCESRSDFLNKCLSSRVVPKSLSVRAPGSSSSQDPHTKNSFENAAFSASIKNLQIACTDARKYAKEERQRYKNHYTDQFNQLSDVDKRRLQDHISKREPQILHTIQHRFKQKLLFLLKSHNGETQDNEPQGIPLTQTSDKHNKTRRFMKRIRFKRHKRKEASQKISLVHNLQNEMPLTQEMSQVLNKGLSYVVTPGRVNETEARADIASWKRVVRWKDYYHNREDPDCQSEPEEAQDESPRDLFKKKKKTNIPASTPTQALDTYIKGVESELLGSIKKVKRTNISPLELKALQELKEAQEEGRIRIAAADKGGGIALMSMEDYIEEMMKQHIDTVHENETGTHPFYEPASADGVKQLCQEIKRILDVGVEAKFISKSDRGIMDPSPKPGRLYGQPKCHKPIKPGHKLHPLRPIVSGSGCVTESISEFVDLCIKEEVRKIPSFIEDTPDMLREFQKENAKGPQPRGTFPVTVDVVGLYTNIPANGEDGGIQAFEKCLNNRSDQSIPTAFLVILLRLVLEGNFFEFNQKIYKQLIGTAMGT